MNTNLNQQNDLTKIIQDQTIDGLRRMIKLSEYPICIGPDYFCINYTYAGEAKKIEFNNRLDAVKWLVDQNIVDGYETEPELMLLDVRYEDVETRHGWVHSERTTRYSWQELQQRIAFDHDFMKLPDIMDAVVLHEMQVYQDLSTKHAMSIFDALFGSLKNYQA